MGVTYVIVKVFVTDVNVIKRHSNVITVWRTSAIEVTELLNNQRSEMMFRKSVLMCREYKQFNLLETPDCV